MLGELPVAAGDICMFGMSFEAGAVFVRERKLSFACINVCVRVYSLPFLY